MVDSASAAGRRQHHVVVVEDEPVTRSLFGGYLQHAGFQVTLVEDGAALRRRMPALAGVDLVLLDIELPGDSGFALAGWLRERSDVGIIFVSRRADPLDHVTGLELGGDDFVVKPPDMDELLARVRAVLRRRRPTPMPQGAGLTRLADWTFDAASQVLVSSAGESVALTWGETRILGELIAAGGRVVARESLVTALSADANAGQSRSLDVLIHRLRKKLGEGGAVEPQILLTVHGLGYRLGVAATPR